MFMKVDNDLNIENILDNQIIYSLALCPLYYVFLIYNPAASADTKRIVFHYARLHKRTRSIDELPMRLPASMR